MGDERLLTINEFAEAIRSLRFAKTREEAAAIEWTIMHAVSLWMAQRGMQTYSEPDPPKDTYGGND